MICLISRKDIFYSVAFLSYSWRGEQYVLGYLDKSLADQEALFVKFNEVEVRQKRIQRRDQVWKVHFQKNPELC